MASTSEVPEQVEDLDPVALRILTLIRANPKGINDKDFTAQTTDIGVKEKADAINKLLKTHYISLLQGKNLVYKSKDPSNIKAEKGAETTEEKIVTAIIAEAGNKGIWMREIKYKSNLAQTQLQKILKALETKKTIKAVKSVAATRKKVYMLYDVEPDTSVTGGAWYQDQDFEAEFVEVLNQQCYRFLEQKRNSPKDLNGPIALRNATYASSNDVWSFIDKLGISKVKLSVGDVEMILDTLIYDGKVEKTKASNESNLYRAIKPLLDPPGLIQSPCGVCPIRKNCCDFGDVTPITCQYISEWLSI